MPSSGAVAGIQEPHDEVARTSSQGTYQQRVQGPPDPGPPIVDGDPRLDVAKHQQNDDGDGDADQQGHAGRVHDEIRDHGDQAADKVAQAHGDSRDPRGAGVRLGQLQLKVHHEPEPALLTLGVPGDAQLVDDAAGCRTRDSVLVEHLVDLLPLTVRAVVDLPPLALILGFPVLTLSGGGQVGAQPHADHAREELGQAADDDELGASQGGEAGRQGEGDGEAVSEADWGGGFVRGLFTICGRRLNESATYL